MRGTSRRAVHGPVGHSGTTDPRAERAVTAAAARYLVAQVARLELLSGVPEADNYRGLLQNYASEPLL